MTVLPKGQSGGQGKNKGQGRKKNGEIDVKHGREAVV
jgi:hypothetical protein